MTLSFEEKKAIFDDYKELTAVPVSMNRINYHFNASAVDHKIAVRFLHPNGNAFIYAGYLPKEETDKGYISVLESDEGTIRFLLEKAISFLKKTADGYVEGYSEKWVDRSGEVLLLIYDNPMWSVALKNGQMEGIFKTRDAAVGYLNDEGFSRTN